MHFLEIALVAGGSFIVLAPRLSSILLVVNVNIVKPKMKSKQSYKNREREQNNNLSEYR